MPEGAGGWSAGANSRAEAKQDSLHVHNFKSGSGPACQPSPASPAQPAQPSQLPSFLVYIFCGSWRENGEKNFIGKLIVPLILVHLLCIQRVGRVGNQSCQRDFAKFHNARRRLLPSY